MSRQSKIERVTKETNVVVELNLDGSGTAESTMSVIGGGMRVIGDVESSGVTACCDFDFPSDSTACKRTSQS